MPKEFEQPRAALLLDHERSGLLHECEANFDAADLDKDILGVVTAFWPSTRLTWTSGMIA